MDRSDSNWNHEIRVDSLLRTRIKRKTKSVLDAVWSIIVGFSKVIFSGELWGVVLDVFFIVVIVGMLGFMISFPIIGIKHANQVERERDAEESRLKSSGWNCINSSDEVSAELLARKRSDAEFGTNNYSFQATNVVNHRFWYLASPKTNTTDRTTQR